MEETKDPVVTIDMSSTTRSAAFTVSVRKVAIDGYESMGRVKDLLPPKLSFGSKLKEATLDNPNWLARFISDRCQKADGGAVGQKTLYQAYEKWAAGHVLYTLPEFDFLQAMREAGYQRKRVGRKLYWANLSLTRPDESREPDAEEKKRLLSLLKDEPDRPAATDAAEPNPLIRLINGMSTAEKLQCVRDAVERLDEFGEPQGNKINAAFREVCDKAERLMNAMPNATEQDAATDAERAKQAVSKMRDGFQNASGTARAFVETVTRDCNS